MIKLPEGCDFEPQYITEKILQDALHTALVERNIFRRALLDCEWSDEKLDELIAQPKGGADE